MRKLTRSDIKTNEEYANEREDRRRRIIALKKLRRVEVGDRLSLNFENRETVAYQIQEMMRVEKIIDESKIQFEIDIYNSLIPETDALSATMFIEIKEAADMRAILDSLQGLDQPGSVYIRIDGEEIPAEFEPGHSREDRISAVHYVTFRFTKDQIRKFLDAGLEIHVRHPAYQAKAAFTAEQRRELIKDFLQ